MARISPVKGQDIQEFLATYPATTTKGASWIQVYSKDNEFQHVYPDEILITQKGKKLMNLDLEGLQKNKKEIDSLAVESNCLSGKWMLKYQDEFVDECWKKIAVATVSGAFGEGSCAKVSTAETVKAMGEGVYTICIYTKDYRNEIEIFNAREQLKNMEVDKKCFQVLYYKPDIFTYLGALDDKLFGATYIYIDPE